MNVQQLENLKNLRDLGRRILEQPERYPLGFGQFECGTFACWIGWYGRARRRPATEAWLCAEQEFGITVRQKLDLFATAGQLRNRIKSIDPTADDHTPAAYTELARRLEYLDSLIAEHEPKVEPKPLPDSIVRIFESTRVETT